MAKINCATCKNLCKMFFQNALCANTRNMLIMHLISCSKCYEYYKHFADIHNYDFEVLDYVFDMDKLQFMGDSAVQKRIEQSLEEFEKSAEAKELLGSHCKDKWTQIAKEYKIDCLMNLQAFRDLAKEYDGKYDSGDVDYKPYYQYITTKIAQRVDHLENCLTKEVVNARP